MLNLLIAITFALALIIALIMGFVDVYTYAKAQATTSAVMLTSGTICIVLCLIKLFIGNKDDT